MGKTGERNTQSDSQHGLDTAPSSPAACFADSTHHHFSQRHDRVLALKACRGRLAIRRGLSVLGTATVHEYHVLGVFVLA